MTDIVIDFNHDKLDTMITNAVRDIFDLNPNLSVYSVDIKHLDEEPVIPGIVPIVGKKYAKNPLFVEYLMGIPEEHRQRFNCDCCYHFIKKFGSLAYLDGEYKIKSLIWSNYSEDPKFEKSFESMKNTVESSKIRFGYTSNETQFGFKVWDGFNHLNFNAKLKTFTNGEREIGKMISKTIQDHKFVTNTFGIYKSSPHYKEALELATHLFENHAEIKTRQKHKATLQKFLAIFEEWDRSKQSSKQKSNLIWEIVTNNTPDVINFKNGVIGQFIEDLQDSIRLKTLTNNYAINSFLTNTKPENYLRPTVAPSQQLIEQAKKEFIELGLFDSLPQRFATPEDVNDYSWTPKKIEEPVVSGTPFDNLTSKEDKKIDDKQINITDGGSITWNVFKRDVLNKADSIELVLNSTCKNFEMISQMVNQEAKPIFRYDQIDNRKTTCSFSFVHPIDRHVFNLPEKVDVVGIRNSELNNHEYFAFISEKAILEVPTPLFPEVILHELHSYRSVIEQYCRQNMIRTDEEKIILGYYVEGATVIVTSGKFKTKYFINGLE